MVRFAIAVTSSETDDQLMSSDIDFTVSPPHRTASSWATSQTTSVDFSKRSIRATRIAERAGGPFHSFEGDTSTIEGKAQRDPSRKGLATSLLERDIR